MTKKNKILIATGGTGGHVFPAYSLANYFIKNNYNVKITIDNRGLKYLKNHENLDLIKIPSSPLIKKNILKFLFSLFVVFSSILKSLIFLSLIDLQLYLEWEVIHLFQFVSLQQFLELNLLFMKII